MFHMLIFTKYHMMMIFQYQYWSCSCVLETANARTRISISKKCVKSTLWEGKEPGKGRRMLAGSPQIACHSKESRARWAAVLGLQSPRCGPCSSGTDPPGTSASLRIVGRKQPLGSLFSAGMQGYIAQYISSAQWSIPFPPTQDLRHILTASAFCKINCSCCIMFRLKATS